MTLLNGNCGSSSHSFTFFFFLINALILITRTPTCTPQTTNFSRVLCNSADVSPEPAAFLVSFNTTLTDLRANLSSPASTGFATVQLVRTTAPIYALFHCRGYTSRSDCLASLDAVFALSGANCYLLHRATIFTDGCYLRYAAINLFDAVFSTGQSGFCDDPTAAERRVGFNETASEALVEVEREVMGREGRFVAGKKGSASGGRRMVYAAGECLPVLGTTDCRRCLESALRNVRGCLPEAGGRAVESGCFMRFSGEEFFNGSLAVDLDLTIRDIGGGE